MNTDTDKPSGLDEYELNAAVAECLMGMERGQCYGTIGGGNISGSGWQQEIHTWFICQWCGRLVEDGRGGGPCPNYPFPEIGVLEIMEALGERDLHVLVRYDPLREGNNWTVMVGQTGRTDTDDPLRWLRVQALKALARPGLFSSKKAGLEHLVFGQDYQDFQDFFLLLSCSSCKSCPFICSVQRIEQPWGVGYV